MLEHELDYKATKIKLLKKKRKSHIPKHTKNSIQEGHDLLPLHLLLHTEKRKNMTHSFNYDESKLDIMFHIHVLYSTPLNKACALFKPNSISECGKPHIYAYKNTWRAY